LPSGRRRNWPQKNPSTNWYDRLSTFVAHPG
jgi:hypothetical protein